MTSNNDDRFEALKTDDRLWTHVMSVGGPYRGQEDRVRDLYMEISDAIEGVADALDVDDVELQKHVASCLMTEAIDVDAGHIDRDAHALAIAVPYGPLVLRLYAQVVGLIELTAHDLRRSDLILQSHIADRLLAWTKIVEELIAEELGTTGEMPSNRRTEN